MKPSPAARDSRRSVKETGFTTGTSDGAYEVTATFSVVESGGKQYRYFDRTKVVRR